MTTIPDLLLKADYVRPPSDHVDFTIYLVGQEPGDPDPPAASVNVPVSLPYRSARRRGARRVDTGWSQPPRRYAGTATAWTLALPSGGASRFRWAGCDRVDLVHGDAWRDAVVRQAAASSPWAPLWPKDAALGAGWSTAVAADARAMSSAWNAVYARDGVMDARWSRASRPASTPPAVETIVALTPSQSQRVPRGDRLVFLLGVATEVGIDFALERRLRYGPVRPGHADFLLDADDGSTSFTLPGAAPYVPALTVVLAGGYVPTIANVLVGTTPPAMVISEQPTAPTLTDPAPASIRWSRATFLDKPRTIRWGHGPQLGPRDPPPYEFPSGSTHEPPPNPIPRQVYFIMNDVEVLLLPDRVPIAVNALDLGTSVDAWCWSFTMELADPTQLPLLKPTAEGPKVVEITVNSYQWTAIIEGRDTARTHASTGGRNATVTGRSQTALLSDAYIARRTLAIGETRTAQQLAMAEITDRVLPFDIDWQGVDWLVPAGVWTYQDLAPIDAISQIAAARGAVVQSAPGDARLLVRSRYPTSPWTWSAGSADIALPLDWVASESAQQQSKPLYDAVFVVGQQQGVLARVSRQGAAGETFAPQVVDSLIVAPEVAVERGRNILSDRGVQDLVTVEIPLFPPGVATAGATGLYVPLLLVDVLDPEDPHQALSVGVSISARRSGDNDSAMEVWQSVSLERHLSDAH